MISRGRKGRRQPAKFNLTLSGIKPVPVWYLNPSVSTALLNELRDMALCSLEYIPTHHGNLCTVSTAHICLKPTSKDPVAPMPCIVVCDIHGEGTLGDVAKLNNMGEEEEEEDDPHCI